MRYINMKIKEITPDQAFEIAKMVYGFPEWIKSDFKFEYQPYDESMYEDAAELVRVCFDAIVFADKTEKITLIIDVQLNCWLHFVRNKGGNIVAESLPSRNQHAVQKKFIEWGFEPEKILYF